jgi:CheY-specific phosphatase CheX
MGVRFFGQFLLEQGVIHSQQLLEAIAHQEKTNRKFGETAIQLGMLDRHRLDKIIDLQRREDLKTGEAGIKLGFLTQEQVDQVLRTQENSYLMLGEALVKTGALNETQLAEQLEAFKKDQDAYRLSSGLPRQKDPTGLAAPAIDLTVKMLERLANLQTKLVDVRYTLTKPHGGSLYMVRMAFTGSHDGEIALRASDHLCAQIASVMLSGPVAVDARPEILDVLCEFLNIVGGNLAALAARQGKKVELSPPQVGEVSTAGRDVVVATLATPDGKIEFMVVSDQTSKSDGR